MLFKDSDINMGLQFLSCVWLFAIPWNASCQASLSITNSRSLLKLMSIEYGHWWCHPTISSSVIPFSSCLQSFPALGSFQMSQFFASGSQSTGFSAPALVLSMNFRTDFLRMDCLDLLAVQGILKNLLQHHSSKASILRHSAFLWSNSHIHMWLLEKS